MTVATGLRPRPQTPRGFFVVAAALLLVAGDGVAATVTAKDFDILESRIRSGDLQHSSAALHAYLQTIGNRLTNIKPKEPPRVRVRALRSWEPIAESLPNGAIYVSAGLIARVQSEAQLAVLIASEIARYDAYLDAVSTGVPDSTKAEALFPSLGLAQRKGGVGVVTDEEWKTVAQYGYAEEEEVQIDKRAFALLVAAKYAPQDAALALGALDAALGAERRSYGGRLGTSSRITARRDSMLAIAAAGDVKQPVQLEAKSELFASMHGILMRSLAADDIYRLRHAEAAAVLDRYELEFGLTGDSLLLRADSLRSSAKGPEGEDKAIAAYRAATQAKPPAARAFKELGFMLRKRGAKAEAAAAFRDYLKASPDAADAVIVATYIEEK